MNKKLITTIVFGIQLAMLTGCGTINRGKSSEPTYKAVAHDIKVLNDPFIFILNLGIVHVFTLASLPIDLTIDTLLYPIDKIKRKNLEKKYELEQEKKIRKNTPMVGVCEISPNKQV